MASGIDAALAADLIDALTGTAPLPATVLPLRLVLVTTASGPTVNGTPLGNTQRQQVVVGPADGSPPATSNTAQVVVTCGAAGRIVGIEVWDSAPDPARKWFGPLAQPRDVVSGQTLVFAIGALPLALSSP